MSASRLFLHRLSSAQAGHTWWMLCGPENYLVRSHQTPVSMGVGARLSHTELAFFPGFGATGGALHRQCLFFRNLHDCIMHGHSAAIWSILTSPPSIKSRYYRFKETTQRMPCKPNGMRLSLPFLIQFRRTGAKFSKSTLCTLRSSQNIDVST